jgi:hypothetical protein
MEIDDMLYLKLVMNAKIIRYFDVLYKTFTHEFYCTLYNYFINRDITDFNTRVIPITDIKNDMIESCKESWLLFFEDN